MYTNIPFTFFNCPELTSYVVAKETLQSFLLVEQLEFARKKLDELNASTVLILETQQL